MLLFILWPIGTVLWAAGGAAFCITGVIVAATTIRDRRRHRPFICDECRRFAVEYFVTEDMVYGMCRRHAGAFRRELEEESEDEDD